MISFLHVLLFFILFLFYLFIYFFFGQNSSISDFDVIICIQEYNICTYFEFVSVHIQK